MSFALQRKNRRSAIMAALLVAGMVSLGFASVPLYRIFCQVTGFGGTTQRVEAMAGDMVATGEMVTIRFDSNTSRNLPWNFVPERHTNRIGIGERQIAFYRAENLGARPVTGTATFNVTPLEAGQYFNKIQCFCFTEQTLQPGEAVRMPVTYFVDPAILDDPDIGDVEEITLSYTFYPVDENAS
ncbi:cytochrome c oxidase assembly protein [Parasphingopyxis lamellibrachiae]|uniref:Cytochrome c oxidase assembly protein CtaG n=1 Tax=Parasphingopyxis lamellibrachiae TaxID=680125 RepID=A0A3D9FK58_9SPHN|nr:cytochrome c oxidase assembly protein [Parasphingopyxis lamellibrachiae]RED17471.1 cytochrome c oxidase assembly protein subunit 11 [Parasphingopyxis lamellibrachiae]